MKITFSRGLGNDVWMDVSTDSGSCWHIKLCPHMTSYANDKLPAAVKLIEELKLFDKTFTEVKSGE